MTETQREERVRLKHALPDLGLKEGDVGVLCSTWSVGMCEIDFVDAARPCRVLLAEYHVERGCAA